MGSLSKNSVLISYNSYITIIFPGATLYMFPFDLTVHSKPSIRRIRALRLFITNLHTPQVITVG